MHYRCDMTGRILTAVLLLLCAVCAKAESHYQPHISVGAHAGASGSRVSFTPGIEQKFLWGPQMGVSIRYAEERLVGVMAEFNYQQRGWNEYYEDSPLQYSRALHYFTLPVMTHIYFGSKRSKCFFNLGPEFAFLVGQKTSSNFDYHNPFQAEGWPDRDRMTDQYTMEVKNHFDYGITAGAGFEYYLKPRNSVFIEFRYYFGLGNIFPSSKADVFSASRNSSIAVTLGYNFRLR